MKKFLSYIRPHLPVMSLQFLVKFGGTIIELFLPWILSTILDDAVPSGNMNSVYRWGGAMILCALLALIANVVANRMAIRTSRNVIIQLRHDLFEKALQLSSSQTDRLTIPSLISRLTTDTYNVHQLLDNMQRLLIRAPILLLGGLVITALLEPVLTLILIAALPFLGLVIWYTTRIGVPMYTEAQTALDRLIRTVQENIHGVRVIKALSKGDYEIAKFDQSNRDLIQKEQRAGITMAVTNPGMNLILNLGLALVIVLGAFRVNAGLTQPGRIVAFLSYITIIITALMRVPRLFVIYSKGSASAKRIAEVLEMSETMKIGMRDPVPGPYHIEFKDVCFSYNKVRNNLTNIRFGLKRGETLGIIGPTGSGKSTLLNLLLRFYDADSGEIRLSGENIGGIPPEVLHTKFGVVFQNDFLFADTIRANIDFGRRLTDAQIEMAAGTAQMDFVSEKSEGFSSLLTIKGANLSGGQKQRLLIARALAANPEILMLDDCSSALDYKTDAELRHALAKGFKDTTTIVVAQRISSIMAADKIMVLDEGRIIGYGSHAELLSTCGSYREIYEAQMGVVM